MSVTASENLGGWQVVYEWLSDGSGDASVADTTQLRGYVMRMVTVPDAVAVPADDYDVELHDGDGADVLAGAGANRDEATPESVNPSAPPYVNGSLTLVVSNAGDAKAGSVRVYLRKSKD